MKCKKCDSRMKIKNVDFYCFNCKMIQREHGKDAMEIAEHEFDVYPEFNKDKHICKLTDGMIYIDGLTMYRVHLEKISQMEYASVEEEGEG